MVVAGRPVMAEMTVARQGMWTVSWPWLVVPVSVRGRLVRGKDGLTTRGNAGLHFVPYVVCVSRDHRMIHRKRRIIYLWLSESKLTWTDEAPSLAARSGLETQGMSRGESFAMTCSGCGRVESS